MIQTEPDNNLLDFDKIQSAYAHLTTEAIKEIDTIVRTYIWLDGLARDAIALPKALDTIGRIKIGIAGLTNILKSELILPANGRAIHSILETISWQDVNFRFSDLLLVLEQSKHTCELAEEYFRGQEADKRSIKEGDGWRFMVGRLLILANRLNLSTTIATPTDTTKNPSKFVAFVSEIQRQVSEKYQPHWPVPTTEQALPHAISHVRKELRKRGILGP
jgi:hypothetical protein